MSIWWVLGIVGFVLVAFSVVIGWAVMRVCNQANRAQEPYEWMGD